MLSDPQGAIFSAYSSSNPGDNSWDNPSPFSWAELNSTDWQAARDFYTDLFNWQETGSMSMDGSGSPESTYWMYGIEADKSMGGMSNAAIPMGAPPHWLHYATVDDLDATLERVKNHGGKLLNGPMDVPGGDRIAQCVDPQGAMFALYEEGGAKG
jgi:predicted enzyme related to lactoylglutathione lyase